MTNAELMYWLLIRRQELVAEAERERLAASVIRSRGGETKWWPRVRSWGGMLWTRWVSATNSLTRKNRMSNRNATAQKL